MKLLLFVSLLSLKVFAAAQTLEPPVLEKNAHGAVTIAVPAGVHARYTIDGSAPNGKSGPYLAPVVLPVGGKVRAVSVSEDRKTLSAPAEIDLPLIKTLVAVPSSIVACTQDRDFPIYDWAKRHAAVTALVKERKSTLVFVGDSITQMFGGEPHDRSQPGKDVWEKYYGKRNVANLGFGYDYTENTLWRLQHGELDGAAAKLVVLNIGTNNLGKNTAEDIAAGVREILKEIRRSQPDAKVLLLGIYPRGGKPNPDATREKLGKVNSLLAELDGKDGVTFVDVGPKLVQPDGSVAKETMGDFLHPTAKGYEIIAEAIEPTVKKLLGE